MVIKDNNWIGTHQGGKIVQSPSFIKIITMIMIRFGFSTSNVKPLPS
ncbi:MAG: hypothetical protein ACFFDH_16015 [Promethearchaeota archaeon]